MRNIEVKAKVANILELLGKTKVLAGTEAKIIKQHDTFYNVPNGRLKFRRLLETGNAELIFYDRPDTEGPKICIFDKVDLVAKNATEINSVLVKALGAKSEVKKVRHLFLVDQTRVHVDEVENLGNFMELEVCLRPEQTPEEGEQIAYDLMEQLGIKKEDLISGAYTDLLTKS